jgi:hypothetical protein
VTQFTADHLAAVSKLTSDDGRLAMLKLVMLAGVMLLILIVAAASRLMPHGTAAETATPQQVYFRLHNDDELVAKP